LTGRIAAELDVATGHTVKCGSMKRLGLRRKESLHSMQPDTEENRGQLYTLSGTSTGKKFDSKRHIEPVRENSYSCKRW